MQVVLCKKTKLKMEENKNSENFSGKRRPSGARPELMRCNASPAKRDEQEAEAAAIPFPL
ncbi:hypothetical protein A3E11_00365 [Candidatus Curtissbacteria bacterium RIFCSPHIGHO2_12_FULL_38_37]|nr:MAG: hypothetical protein A3E11_00365 [Candidatus Curtissbacteria bacterium RIFCSPHIGHO2_12_FULL_38_37]